MAKTTTKKGGVTSKIYTATRDGQTFTFENTEGLTAEQFAIECEKAMTAQLAAQKRFGKYQAIGKDLVQQAETGKKASDFDELVKRTEEFETEFPEYSEGFTEKLAKIAKEKKQ